MTKNTGEERQPYVKMTFLSKYIITVLVLIGIMEVMVMVAQPTAGPPPKAWWNAPGFEWSYPPSPIPTEPPFLVPQPLPPTCVDNCAAKEIHTA